MTAENTLPEIILVDDDPEAVVMMRGLLERGGVAHPVRDFASGEEAVAYLRERRQADQAPDLCLALLDIRMPGMSGLELLAWIKGQPDLQFLPVVMLTISNEPADVTRARELGADTYLLKFPVAETLAAVVREAERAATSTRSRT